MGAYISPTTCPKFGSEVTAFDTALEAHVVDRGWFGEKPSKVVARWAGRGVLAIVAGVVADHRRGQHPVLGPDAARRGAPSPAAS